MNVVTCCGAEQPVTDGDLRHDRSVGEGGGVEEGLTVDVIKGVHVSESFDSLDEFVEVILRFRPEADHRKMCADTTL